MPAATMQQIQAVRTQARTKLNNQGANGEDFKSCDIVVAGNLGPDPGSLARHMMGVIQTKVGFTFREVAFSQRMGVGEWALYLDPVTQNPTGKIRIQVENTNAAKELQAVAHNQVVSIGGDNLAVKVNNFDIMELPQCLGNALGNLLSPPGPPPGL